MNRKLNTKMGVRVLDSDIKSTERLRTRVSSLEKCFPTRPCHFLIIWWCKARVHEQKETAAIESINIRVFNTKTQATAEPGTWQMGS